LDRTCSHKGESEGHLKDFNRLTYNKFRLEVFENRILRRGFGPKREWGVEKATQKDIS
jgi:hypothetical protein